nr:MAG TPA: hypothetical protein [Caudoviricetes sp.]
MRGGVTFSGGVFGVVCIPVCNMFCFGYITMFLLGVLDGSRRVLFCVCEPKFS